MNQPDLLEQALKERVGSKRIIERVHFHEHNREFPPVNRRDEPFEGFAFLTESEIVTAKQVEGTQRRRSMVSNLSRHRRASALRPANAKACPKAPPILGISGAIESAFSSMSMAASYWPC